MSISVLIIIVGSLAFALAARRFNKLYPSEARGSGSVDVKLPDASNVVVRTAQPAHAARARKQVDTTDGGFTVVLPSQLQDIYSRTVDTTSKHLGIVSGSSCRRYGFKDGDLFLGDRLVEADVLNPGDFVVVDAVASGSNIRQRIRRVSKVGEFIEFNDDENGNPHKSRSRDEIIARITHILA